MNLPELTATDITKFLQDRARQLSPGRAKLLVTAKIDWERGKDTLELSADQSRAVEAKMDGLDLQAAEARDELGGNAKRVAAVRRSLEPDRRLGRQLRRYFAAYKRAG